MNITVDNPLGVDHVYGPEIVGGPLEPWIVRGAIEQIEAHLFKSHRNGKSIVFEYGAGTSTLWLTPKCKFLVSVEHVEDWAARVKDVILSTCNRVGWIHVKGITDGTDYEDVIRYYPDDTFDVVLVDGRKRVMCIKAAVEKVKAGGLLVLDNAERERYSAARQFMKALGWKWKDHVAVDPLHASSQDGNHVGELWTTVWTRPPVA